MTIYELINALMQYGKKKELYDEEDKWYIINSLLSVFKLQDYKDNDYVYKEEYSIVELLDMCLEYAINNNIIENTQVNKDLFDTKIMGCFMPRPSELNHKFNELKKESSKKATDYFYKLSKDINYIRESRIQKNINYESDTDYGKIQITINLSKPEKDPNDIKKLLNIQKVEYPKCMLCKENVNYEGRIDFPARQTLRFVPLTLNNHKFYMQYSPYSYYNEHIICFRDEHFNMKVDIEAIKELLDFIDQFPHYFIGSNAGLPIVGGSILNHHHFQGGRAILPIENASKEFVKENNNVEYYALKWPLSTIRLVSSNKQDLINEAKILLDKWNNYNNESLMIINKDKDGEHNAFTPIARYKNNKYELDIILRNNLTTEERPLGLYHISEKYWNIKKENIGLIEAAGLAILPARLKEEIEIMKRYLLNEIISEEEYKKIEKHQNFMNSIKTKSFSKENIDEVIRKEIANTFVLILEDCGVFKKENKREFIEFIRK